MLLVFGKVFDKIKENGDHNLIWDIISGINIAAVSDRGTSHS